MLLKFPLHLAVLEGLLLRPAVLHSVLVLHQTSVMWEPVVLVLHVLPYSCGQWPMLSAGLLLSAYLHAALVMCSAC